MTQHLIEKARAVNIGVRGFTDGLMVDLSARRWGNNPPRLTAPIFSRVSQATKSNQTWLGGATSTVRSLLARFLVPSGPGLTRHLGIVLAKSHHLQRAKRIPTTSSPVSPRSDQLNVPLDDSHGDPGANLAELGRLLKQVHIVPLLAQPNRREDPADPTADDGDRRFVLSVRRHDAHGPTRPDSRPS